VVLEEVTSSMRGTVVDVNAEDDLSPTLVFEIKIENDRDKRVLFTGIASRVMTSSPMKQNINLGRLIPGEALMFINPKSSSTYRFYLEMDRRKLDYIEKIRVDDVWLDVYMSTVFLELEDWCLRSVGWESFSVTTERYTKVRIPESDWRKLREVLGYGKARVIEVSEETYKLLEEWREKLKVRNLDEALHEALLFALGRK
jgi:hypothetical protein